MNVITEHGPDKDRSIRPTKCRFCTIALIVLLPKTEDLTGPRIAIEAASYKNELCYVEDFHRPHRCKKDKNRKPGDPRPGQQRPRMRSPYGAGRQE